MKYDSSNLPELGVKVWFIEEDKKTMRPVVKSGFVFAQVLRYEIGPLILVDTTSIKATDMSQSGADISKRCSPGFLFNSVDSAGKELL